MLKKNLMKKIIKMKMHFNLMLVAQIFLAGFFQTQKKLFRKLITKKFCKKLYSQLQRRQVSNPKFKKN